MTQVALLPQSAPKDQPVTQRPDRAPDAGADPEGSFAQALDRASNAEPAQVPATGSAEQRDEDKDKADAEAGTPASTPDGTAAHAPLTIDALNQLLLLGQHRPARTPSTPPSPPPPSAPTPRATAAAASAAPGVAAEPRERQTARVPQHAARTDTGPVRTVAPPPGPSPTTTPPPPAAPADTPNTARPPTTTAPPADVARSSQPPTPPAPPPSNTAPVSPPPPVPPARAAADAPPARNTAPSQVLRIVAAPAGARAGGGEAGQARIALGQGAQPVTTPKAARQDLLTAQMSRMLAAAAARGGDTLTMRLTPDTLGAMTIRVDVREGAVSASFAAATAEARDLLESSLTTLRSALEARGLAVERLAVELTPATPHATTPDPASPEGQHGGEGQQTPTDAGGGSADGRPDQSAGRGHPYPNDARAGTDADAGALSPGAGPPPMSVFDTRTTGGFLLGIDAIA